ncbi:MAG: exo-alpha-sialidase [Planctomycetia bacterium]|nr:exo-alpha-sialidase [Planctomycetia bacterium]
MIRPLASGHVYRNPKPHLAAIHAWHPSLVRLSGGNLLATFDLAQAVESLDYHTCQSRSTDGGQTWTAPVPLFQDTSPRRSTHSVRISAMRDGLLVGIGGRFYRDDPNEGLVNRANLGYVPMDLFLLRSSDEGRTWKGPQSLAPPLVGPAFEMCHRVVELADGRWLFPTSTWRGWNGEAPHGMQAVALVSHDRGRSWPDYVRVVDQTARGVISWEQGLAQLPDGRLVAIVWSFDETSGQSLPNRFAVSRDGKAFSSPRENGMQGETAKLLALADGRLLCLYRRLDKPGLWAQLAKIEGETWIPLEEAPLWQGAASGMSGARSSSDELSGLKFGYPSMIERDDGLVLAVFWCVEDCQHVIRCQTLQVG